MGELAHIGYVAVGLFAVVVAALVVVNLVAQFVTWMIDGGWAVLLGLAWLGWGVVEALGGR